MLKRDICVIKSIFVAASYLGTFPLEHKTIQRRVLIAILTIVHMIGAICIIMDYKHISTSMKFEVTEKFLMAVQMMALFLFNGHCLYGSINDNSLWKSFFENIEKINKRFKHSIKLVKVMFKWILFVLFYSCIYIIAVWRRRAEMSNYFLFSSVYWVMLHLEMLLLTLVTCQSSNFLSIRYTQLQKFLLETFSADSITIDEDLSHYENVQEIKLYILTIHKAATDINRATGKMVLTLLILTFLSMLSIFNLLLFIYKTMNFWHFLPSIGKVLENVSLLVFSLAIILSCDKVEKTSKELINTCTYIYASKGSEDALMLLNLAKELRPKFTAAGFFEINQRLLPTFLSNLSTYLIIILQFKFSAL
ncbi:gustatory receptor 68a-like isoform X1 [Diabrotica virgifera virgifera]|uniref:Gustatory receptor n=1 Tax=Diabrotica virgifera virgifera TaxID=50390 RepID=A0A6P7F098_DIAVI|nr:gustatory receptor 68a-like isoform X1 [Diabrotica virgifera virgifera]